VTTVSEKDRLWSLPETAEYLGVQPSTLYQWAARGVGPRSFLVGRLRKYKPHDVMTWLDGNASDQAGQ
jgi:excisionase family DNA binding protein